jgi:beta-fructofuranosidase
MLITARSAHGPASAPQDTIGRGVLGHAWSADLEHWEIREPLTAPGSGFGQLEVPHVAEVDGRHVLVFNCLSQDMSIARREGTTGGIWAVPIDSPTGPYDVARAHLLADPRLYVGKLVRGPSGSWVLLAFHNTGSNGDFGGALSDPMPVRWDGGNLVIAQTTSTTVGSPLGGTEPATPGNSTRDRVATA